MVNDGRSTARIRAVDLPVHAVGPLEVKIIPGVGQEDGGFVGVVSRLTHGLPLVLEIRSG
jgi:hypothetical protein